MALLSSFHLHPGDPAPPFSLPGTDGRNWSRSDFDGAPVLVVVFTCNHCPYAQAWEGRLIALQRTFADAGVRFVLINSNETVQHPEDRFERMVERARERHYPFPYLRDDSQEVAHAYGALVTPHPFVFDAGRRLTFQGPVDEDYEHPDRAKHHYLEQAIRQTLAGSAVETPERSVLGCSVKWRT